MYRETQNTQNTCTETQMVKNTCMETQTSSWEPQSQLQHSSHKEIVWNVNFNLSPVLWTTNIRCVYLYGCFQWYGNDLGSWLPEKKSFFYKQWQCLIPWERPWANTKVKSDFLVKQWQWIQEMRPNISGKHHDYQLKRWDLVIVGKTPSRMKTKKTQIQETLQL